MSERYEQWRCECGTLLGVVRGPSLHLKYKRAEYLAYGKVVAICPRCSRRCERAAERSADLTVTHSARAGPDP